MNEHVINAMIALIRKVICGKEIDEKIQAILTPELLPQLYALSKSHDMAHIVAQGLLELGLLGADEASKKFQKQQMLAVYRYQKLNYDLEQICQALENAQIPFIPLKGSVLRSYYPEPWMRTSCDIDVLVHEADLAQAISVLESVGYQKVYMGTHDVSLHSPNEMHLELHYATVEEGRALYAREVLEHIWEAATPKENNSSHMLLRDEMFYFYHVAHIVKHFEYVGCGMRPFLDLWILQHCPGRDDVARKTLLEKGGLLRFEEMSRALAEVWFDGADMTEILDRMQQYVLSSGIYGSVDNFVITQQNKYGSKANYLFSRLFVSYDHLKTLYPILKKHKWLFPVMQVRRWFRVFAKGKLKTTVHELDVSRSMSYEKKTETAELFDALGLN